MTLRPGLLAIGLALGAAAVLPADAAAACATPVAAAPAYARGTANRLSWTQGSPAGAGFVVEASVTSATDADGSFVDSGVVRVDTQVPSTRSFYDFSGLAERRHYFHVRAKGGTSCADGAWSATVATVQDATAPSAAIGTADGTVYSPLDAVALSGTAADEPAPTAPAASGADRVIVQLQNATPVVGPMFDLPPPKVVPVTAGAWSATVTGVAPGLYVASASAVDQVGNQGDAATVTIVVAHAP